jgi:predicted dehydrogenase
VNQVRVGVIGIGNMGSSHARALQAGNVKRAVLAAVCDLDPERLGPFDDKVAKFTDSAALIRSGTVDAVIIATPHYDHTTIGIDALAAGLHVLVEKPISVHKADCERLIAAHRSKKQVFAAMFNQRTVPAYRKVKQLIASGELGAIQRINWIITNWFRSETYYASGGWRATWAGEGGGVLLNQSPHNLDMMQWLFGMPSSVRAFCALGKYHKIEVEDEVTAYLEYPDGATGIFITTTGEAPGTNRLEIAADRGRLVVEEGKLRFLRNETPTRQFSRETKLLFGTPEVWDATIPAPGTATAHTGIMQNFTDAILDGAPLIAPAAEGLKSVELGNAMLYSSLTGRTVSMPLDGRAYERALRKLIKTSTYVKQTVQQAAADMNASFSK